MNSQVRLMGEIIVSGLLGTPVTEFQYEIVKKYIPHMFCNITVFPITCCNDFNAVLSNIDRDWVRYIPNHLKSTDFLKICNTLVRHEACAYINQCQTKDKLLPFIRAYNEAGYLIGPIPQEWPQNWRYLSVASYSTEDTAAVARLIINGHQMSPRKKLMHKITLIMRNCVKSSRVCFYCQCDFGLLYKNPYCSHIQYFHRECLDRDLNTPRFQLECPVRFCSAYVDLFGASASILMEPEIAQVMCYVCEKWIQLGEIYCREPYCHHTYHQRCMNYSATDRRCIETNCPVRLSMSVCHWKNLVCPQIS
jgi:hypothetical protein